MLVSAKILGELFQRLKQPALVGELLAGIIIGPSLFNIVQTSDSLKVLTNLAVFFLMFLAGLELHPQEIRKAGKGAAIVSIAAFVIPFVSGAWISDYLGFSNITSLFVGLTLAITAVPVNAIVLMEFGMLKSKIGTTVLTAGVINDILSLIVLGIIIQISESGSQEFDIGATGVSVFVIVIFLAVIGLLSYIFGQASHTIRERISPQFQKLRGREAAFGIMFIVAIGMALVAEYVGLHFVIGAFFAGLIIYRELVGHENFERVRTVFSAITFGLFAPIFFTFIGLEINAPSIAGSIPLFSIILAVAIIGKIVGGLLGAKIAGFSLSEGKTISYLMNSRGMVELVIATVGLELGILDLTLFSVVVLVGFITTIMSPIMARRSLRGLQDKSGINDKKPESIV
ncbi:MAG: cation:proton antiporter [Nitrososphaerota archaeon]